MEKPRIIIPKVYGGISIDEAYEKIMAGSPVPDTSIPENQAFEFKNPDIVGSDYIRIPGINRVISRFELAGYNNMNWQNTHFKLHDNGLYMPTIPEFMQHFLNVLDVFKSNGKKKMLDANGNPISEKDTEDLYKHLTTNHLPQYGGSYGTWTWLDALFSSDGNSLKFNSEHRTSKNQGERILVPKKSEPLEACLTGNFWAGLKLNRQGLPVEQSSSNSNKPGENIYFWPPVADRVARFYAYSGGAGLDCDGSPVNWDPGLGVYAVAEAGS